MLALCVFSFRDDRKNKAYWVTNFDFVWNCTPRPVPNFRKLFSIIHGVRKCCQKLQQFSYRAHIYALLVIEFQILLAPLSWDVIHHGILNIMRR